MILLSRIPYPLEKGDKLRAFNQIKLLAKENEITLCCLTDSKPHKEAHKILSEFCKNTYFIKLNKFKIYQNTLSSYFDKKPLQTHYFYQEEAQKKIDQIIQDHAPQHIYCQLIRVTEYVKKYSFIPKTLDYMDCLSVGMKRRSNKTSLLSTFFKDEAKRLANYENLIFDLFEHKTIISEQDKQEIKHPLKNNIHVIPNGIDTSFFSPTAISRDKEFDLVFTGNMGYPPNIDCAQYLASEIMPLLVKKKPEIKLLISGANPSAKVRKLANKNIIVTGWVDDIRESYAKGKIFIAPLKLGSGLQNKLLEAMAMQIPCITSQLANGALNANQNEQILIAEKAQEYVQHIFKLLEDKPLYNRISKNGYEHVLENFSWQSSVNKLNNILHT